MSLYCCGKTIGIFSCLSEFSPGNCCRLEPSFSSCVSSSHGLPTFFCDLNAFCSWPPFSHASPTDVLSNHDRRLCRQLFPLNSMDNLLPPFFFSIHRTRLGRWETPVEGQPRPARSAQKRPTRAANLNELFVVWLVVALSGFYGRRRGRLAES